MLARQCKGAVAKGTRVGPKVTRAIEGRKGGQKEEEEVQEDEALSCPREDEVQRRRRGRRRGEEGE